jgi:hypothetical protein
MNVNLHSKSIELKTFGICETWGYSIIETNFERGDVLVRRFEWMGRPFSSEALAIVSGVCALARVV